MSGVTYVWVLSRMNESCHVCMSHVTYEWVMECVRRASCHTRSSSVFHSPTWLSTMICVYMCAYNWVVSRMYESCHVWMSPVAYEWVLSRMNESCHVWMSHVTYEWVMSRMNESCHVWMSHVTYDWVMSRMNESCPLWVSRVTCDWVMWMTCPTWDHGLQFVHQHH